MVEEAVEVTIKDRMTMMENWKNGLIEGVEQRMNIEHRIEDLEDRVAELQSYVAEQTFFVDDRVDLIDALKVAHKGLKPGATATQQNIAYYAVRGILSTEIED